MSKEERRAKWNAIKKKRKDKEIKSVEQVEIPIQKKDSIGRRMANSIATNPYIVAGGILLGFVLGYIALKDKFFPPKNEYANRILSDSADLGACPIQISSTSRFNPWWTVYPDSMTIFSIAICDKGKANATNLTDTLYLLGGNKPDSIGIAPALVGIFHENAKIYGVEGIVLTYGFNKNNLQEQSIRFKHLWIAIRIRYTDKYNKAGLFENIYEASGIKTYEPIPEVDKKTYHALSENLKDGSFW